MPNIPQQAGANDARYVPDANGQRPVMPPPFSLPPFMPFGSYLCLEVGSHMFTAYLFIFCG